MDRIRELRKSVPIVTSDTLTHSIIWHCSLLASSEHASIVEGENDRRLRGIAVLPLEGEPCHIDYDVICDAGWMPRSLRVSVIVSTQVRTIELRSDHVGHWEVNGNAARRLSGCSDVDLGWTPATNTIPIRRLDLEVGTQPTLALHGSDFPNLM